MNNDKSLPTLSSPPSAPPEPSDTERLEAIKKIRKFDCGAWLQNSAKGAQKRIELMHLLDALYATAGLKPE